MGYSSVMPDNLYKIYNVMYFVAPLLWNLSNEQVTVNPSKSNVNGKEAQDIFRKSSVLERSTGKLRKIIGSEKKH